MRSRISAAGIAIDSANDVESLGGVLSPAISRAKRRFCTIVAASVHKDGIAIKMAKVTLTESLAELLCAHKNFK